MGKLVEIRRCNQSERYVWLDGALLRMTDLVNSEKAQLALMEQLKASGAGNAADSR